MKDLTVIQAKRYGTIHCSSQDTLLEAARSMVQEDISGLVVVDAEGFLKGIFTRKDLLRARLETKEWQQCHVEQYMTPDVVTVTPKDLLSHVAQLLLDRHIHRVVIVENIEGKQRPIGVISDADLVYHMTRER